MIEELKDIEGSESLVLQWGDRFKGWYLTKKPVRRQNIALVWKGNPEYSFPICNYNYKFIMPSFIEFSKGIISYTEVDRLFGVFRFPRDENGDYVTPMSVMKSDGMLSLNEEEIKKMLKRKSPLVFNAYKIPQFGFEYINITDQVIKDIEHLTDSEFSDFFKKQCETYVESRVKEIKEKILKIPNFLLILSNTLNGLWRSPKEIESATDKILFFE